MHWFPVTSTLFVIVRSCCNQFKFSYKENKKYFRNLFFSLWKLHHNLNICKKKITLTAYVSPKLLTAKDMVIPMWKKPRFGIPFNIEHVKGSETLMKSEWQHFYHISWSLGSKPTWKVSLLVICEIIDHIVNTLSTDDMYSLANSQTLWQPIQM